MVSRQGNRQRHAGMPGQQHKLPYLIPSQPTHRQFQVQSRFSMHNHCEMRKWWLATQIAALRILDQTFLFDFDTKAVGIELFSTLHAAHWAECEERQRVKAAETVATNARRDLEATRDAARYKAAVAEVQALEDWAPKLAEIEQLLIDDRIADFYILIKAATQEHLPLLQVRAPPRWSSALSRRLELLLQPASCCED